MIKKNNSSYIIFRTTPIFGKSGLSIGYYTKHLYSRIKNKSLENLFQIENGIYVFQNKVLKNITYNNQVVIDNNGLYENTLLSNNVLVLQDGIFYNYQYIAPSGSSKDFSYYCSENEESIRFIADGHDYWHISYGNRYGNGGLSTNINFTKQTLCQYLAFIINVNFIYFNTL